MKLSRKRKEEMTLRAYDNGAGMRNTCLNNFDFWREDFEKFRYSVPRGSVIDIGCGAGRDALLFKEYYPLYEYIGIDASPEMISEAKRLVPSADFRVMNMYNLARDFQENYFDGFWASCSLLHVSNKKFLRFFRSRLEIVLSQVRKIVKNGGTGFIAMKKGEGEKIIYEENGEGRLFVLYQLTEFSEILRKNGFEILESIQDFKDFCPMTDETIYLKYFVRAKK